MQQYIVSDSENGLSLEKYVRKVLGNAPLSFIYKLFRKKDIKVNGHWQKEKYILSSGDEVSIYVTDEQLKDFENQRSYVASEKIKDWVLYEDKNILIINKPRGVLVQQDDKGNKDSLDNLVIEYLISKGEYNPANEHAFKPGPAHRIDRNTSGIVIFGKNHETLVYLFELLKEHELIGKHYLSLVVGNVEKDGEIDAPIRKNIDLNKMVVAPLKSGAKSAKTIYHVFRRFNGYTLLDLTLVTGRTHQIRVHMSYIRHHVVGDTKYGDYPTNNLFEKQYGFKNQFLHAYQIHFGKLHKPLEYLSSKMFEAPMPQEYIDLLDKLEPYTGD